MNKSDETVEIKETQGKTGLFDSQISLTIKELFSLSSFLIIIGGGIYGYSDMKDALKKLSDNSEQHQVDLKELGGRMDVIANDIEHIENDISEIKDELKSQ